MGHADGMVSLQGSTPSFEHEQLCAGAIHLVVATRNDHPNILHQDSTLRVDWYSAPSN